MTEKASEYRARLSEIRQLGRKRWRTPRALREEITEWARELQSSGYAVSWIAFGFSKSKELFRSSTGVKVCLNVLPNQNNGN